MMWTTVSDLSQIERSKLAKQLTVSGLRDAKSATMLVQALCLEAQRRVRALIKHKFDVPPTIATTYARRYYPAYFTADSTPILRRGPVPGQKHSTCLLEF